MQIFHTVADLSQYLDSMRATHHIAFVPTMGALHDGHLELVRIAHQQNASKPVLVVCSIFVNPTQFGDPKDLEKYPRTLDSDCAQLRTVGCDAVFAPSVQEVYPADWQTPKFDFGHLVKSMEGASRPGHFAGVGQVVHRLLCIVAPDFLLLGQKDFQQVAVIKHMVYTLLGWKKPKIVVAPIVREPDGLAMSSRNVRLSPTGRAAAAGISQTLFQAQKLAETAETLAEVGEFVRQNYDKLNFDVDYVEVIDRDSLQPAAEWADAPSGAAICVVVRIDGVRLLDNVLLE